MGKHHVIKLTAALAAMVAVSACGVQKMNDAGSPYRIIPGNFEAEGLRNETLAPNYLGEQRAARDPSWGTYGMTVNEGGLHRNETLVISDRFAGHIERLDGVSRAIVVVSDLNAYVAVQLDGRLSEWNGQAMNNGSELQSVPYADQRNPEPGETAAGAQTETGRFGTSEIRGMPGYDRSIRQYNDAGQINAGAPRLADENGRTMDQPSETRSHGAGIGAAGSASGTEHSYGGHSSFGYGSATMADGVSSFLKTQIEHIIRSADTRIRHVFVSSNPEFVERIADTKSRIDQGGSPQLYVKQFNGMAERFFPTPLGGEAAQLLRTSPGADAATQMGTHRDRNAYGIYPSLDNNFVDRGAKSLDNNNGR